MKIYVAAAEQPRAQALANNLMALGHTITSTWVFEDLNRTSEYTNIDRVKIAIKDHDEILESDALIIMDSKNRVPGGKFVEVGIALGAGKKVYLLGVRENMLMWHPKIVLLETLEHLSSNKLMES